MVTGTGTGTGTETGTEIGTETTADPTITLVEVYPNPLQPQDHGEFVTVDVTRPTNLSSLTLSDGEDTVRLPPIVVSGRVRLVVGTGTPPNGTGDRTLPVSGELALANREETITLRQDGTVIDRVRYTNAPAGKRFVRERDGWSWQSVGVTQFKRVTISDVPIRAFVLPDGAAIPAQEIRNASHRLLLGGYTFTSKRIARQLCRVEQRGVQVHVLVDADPVGGLTAASRDRLDGLVECGVDVDVLGGSNARYVFHHAKYVVVDDRAMILSENWKPSGTGGRANRGWGVVVDSERFTDRLAAVFRNDTTWRDTPNWTAVRPMETVGEDRAITATAYPTHFEAQSLRAETATLLVAPDNAEAGLLDMVRGANDTIAIQQVHIDGQRFSLLAATVAAARRGVTVRILLSNAWYVRDENQILIDRLRRLATREDLPLSVRLVDPGGAFERSHVKGVIVDTDAVFVGSVNWNPHSLRENREVGVVLTGEDVGRYYTQVFDRDWRRSGDGLLTDVSIPTEFLTLVAAVVLGVSVVVLRQLHFGDVDDGAE